MLATILAVGVIGTTAVYADKNIDCNPPCTIKFIKPHIDDNVNIKIGNTGGGGTFDPTPLQNQINSLKTSFNTTVSDLNKAISQRDTEINNLSGNLTKAKSDIAALNQTLQNVITGVEVGGGNQTGNTTGGNTTGPGPVDNGTSTGNTTNTGNSTGGVVTNSTGNNSTATNSTANFTQ
jgi:hypothetical protein